MTSINENDDPVKNFENYIYGNGPTVVHTLMPFVGKLFLYYHRTGYDYRRQVGHRSVFLKMRKANPFSKVI